MTDLPRENVQSYPRPPALEPVPQRIIIRLGGALVADTTCALRVLETHHAPTYYLPLQDIHACARPKAAAFANGRALRDISMCWQGLQQRLALPGPMTIPPRGLQTFRAMWRFMRP
jgi:hypothetical protein